MGPTATAEDGAVIAALRSGDEAAFVTFAVAESFRPLVMSVA